MSGPVVLKHLRTYRLETMTKETDNVACRYTAQLVTKESRYVIEVPDAEVEFGPLTEDGAYRVTIEHLAESQTSAADGAQKADGQSRTSGAQAPVTEGDRLDITIEDLGQQGDGIARVGPGYIIIVPGSSVGDTLTVEVQEVNPSFGFAEIVSQIEQGDSPNDESSPDAQDDSQSTTEDDKTQSDTDELDDQDQNNTNNTVDNPMTSSGNN